MKRIVFVWVVFSVMSQFIVAQNAWFTNAADAKTYAADKKVPVLLVFAGSDWCKPCMMLKAEILHSPDFEAYFPSRMALLYLDFPMQAKNKLAPELKKQNELLAEKYNRSGSFPNLVLIDINGKELGQLKYTHQTPAVFIQQCNDLLSKVAVNQ